MIPKIGPELSPTVLKRIQEVEQEMETLRQNLAIPTIIEDERVEQLINADEEFFNNLTSEQCEEASFVLNRFSLKIQMELNKYQALMVWCTNNIRYIIADETAKHQSYSYDERKYSTMKQIPVARELEAVRVESELKYDSLLGLSDKIQAVARCYSNLSQRRSKYSA